MGQGEYGGGRTLGPGWKSQMMGVVGDLPWWFGRYQMLSISVSTCGRDSEWMCPHFLDFLPSSCPLPISPILLVLWQHLPVYPCYTRSRPVPLLGTSCVTGVPSNHPSVLAPKLGLGRSGAALAFSARPSYQPLQEGICPG